ncbi:hypothetical protein A1O7_09514 [Cladophialophora yegresii CBS 114405]|uniref:Altered inheritance of mitochondria protein 9, mitochondrial n=1 Tax=Cladophialophora yegresii CBS 114405 TaxID=1182544 RepID=W9VEX6_9EURO|nr:uncharacterized protein A1O7_09514 [Cladophialophora yegresii CBS 114405]EXJ54177.1 hypothetical protein A1O7_09514 [Cladophialophora yegresii CBS 114405]
MFRRVSQLWSHLLHHKSNANPRTVSTGMDLKRTFHGGGDFQSTASLDPSTDTSGRWLHRDKAQRQARSLKFDFALLCQKAINVCPGAKSVVQCEKTEGGFNRVFIFSLDNGAHIVAKLAFRVAGSPDLMTSSEVVTMAYGKVVNVADGDYTREYTDALLDAAYERLPNLSKAEHAAELSYRGSVEEHVRLLQISKAVIKGLNGSPVIRDVSAPILLHPDLNKRNIYVSRDDPTQITALIDWQSTYVEPTCVYANESPDLTAASPNISSIPEMDDELRGKAGPRPPYLSTDLRSRTPWIRAKARSRQGAGGNTPESDAVCHSSWRDRAPALRQELIDLSQPWPELGHLGSCPYQPLVEALAEHAKQWEDFKTVLKFKIFLIRVLDSNSEGWISTDGWEAAKATHKQLYEQWMETVRESEDPEMNEERGRRLRPWDES